MYLKFFIIFLTYCLLIVIIAFLIIRYLRNKIKSEAFYVTRISVIQKNKLVSMYRTLVKLPLISGYLRRISRRYEILCPKNKNEIYKRSMLFALIVWCISGTFISIIFGLTFVFKNLSFYHFAVSIFLTWFINSKATKIMVRNGEKRLLKQLKEFISDIRHFYYDKGSIEEALEKTIDLTKKEMKIHAQIIFDIITSENMDDEIDLYNDTTQNNFLKMFLAQCVTLIKYGDKNINGSSLFLNNLINLKSDIYTEIRKINRIQSLFMGIDFMIVTPVLFMDLLRLWAVDSFPSLHNYYYGEKGIIALVIMFILTTILYILEGYLEENNMIIKKNYEYLEAISNIKFFHIILDNYIKKHFGKIETLRVNLKRMGENITPKQLIVKQILFAALTITFGIPFFLYMHSINQKNIIFRIDNIDQITSIANEQDQQDMKNIIVSYIVKFKDSGNLKISKIEKRLSEKFNSNTIAKNVSDEIFKRINNYQNEYLKWYEIVIVLLFAYIAYYLPYWMILFRKNVMKLNMNNEVIQFQSIIIMLMHIDRISITEILEFMEGFAVVFKDSIRLCLNEYDSGDIEALQRLKEREQYKPFQRLIDDHLMSDMIGIEKAFDEVSSDRKNNKEEREDEEEENIKNKGILAAFIGYSFLITVIGFYLAVPFVLECFKQLKYFNSSIKGM